MEVLGWRSDAELVDGVRRGEDFAFGRLFERWFGRVLGEAQDILGDPQAAAEVATDTFHALWYHLDRLEDPEGFGAWAVETSRTFARERLTRPENREEGAPVPMLATAPDAAAAVAVALVARGLPSAAGLGEALHGAVGAIGSPFGPATAAGFAGPAPAPAGFAGAVPSSPPPAGFAGATLPAPSQPPPAGFAGGAPGPGFAGTPGSGSILGGTVGQAAEMATQAMPPLGAFGPADESLPRVHRYEPPPRGGLLRSPQALAGIAATVILVVVGALLLATRGDDNETATDAVSTTVPPAAPSISEPTSASAGTGATTATTASTTSESSTTSVTESSITSTTRRTTTASTATTRATTTSTATTRATTTATSGSTTGSTTATTSATTPTTAPTTASTEPTTATTSVTRTTPTTASTTTSSTIPKPVITTFTVAANPRGACAGAAANLLPYTAAWSASNADTSSLAVNGVTYDGAGKGSKNFCATAGTRVALTVTGPGGKASQAKTTP